MYGSLGRPTVYGIAFFTFLSPLRARVAHARAREEEDGSQVFRTVGEQITTSLQQDNQGPVGNVASH